jgi:psiF repeat
MRGSLWMVTAAAVLAVGFAQVPVARADTAATAATGNTQQDKMKACNAEAKTKAPTGDAHKQFMSNCLSAHPATDTAAKGNSQQEKMKACNAEAKTKAPTGDAHKQFMSDCLKGSSTTP